VEILLGAGIDINAVDKNGYTALHVALLNKHDAMVELLLKKIPLSMPLPQTERQVCIQRHLMGIVMLCGLF
jgi:hypothetical protein